MILRCSGSGSSNYLSWGIPFIGASFPLEQAEEAFEAIRRNLGPIMNFHEPCAGPVMLSAAKHLSAHRDRPFAALRVTTHDRCCLLKFIIGPYSRVPSNPAWGAGNEST